MEAISKYQSPLGTITMAGNEKSLTGLWFDGQKYYAETLPPDIEEKELPIFQQTADWLDLYFHGQIPDFTPPLQLRGSSFRLAVWNILLQIPYGQTISYGRIAQILAEKEGKASVSAQAVGGAVGHNPISIIVPCHRVVGKDGSLTGYAGGIEKKIDLLFLEHADMSKLYIPKKGTAL